MCKVKSKTISNLFVCVIIRRMFRVFPIFTWIKAIDHLFDCYIFSVACFFKGVFILTINDLKVVYVNNKFSTN